MWYKKSCVVLISCSFITVHAMIKSLDLVYYAESRILNPDEKPVFDWAPHVKPADLKLYNAHLNHQEFLNNLVLTEDDAARYRQLLIDLRVAGRDNKPMPHVYLSGPEYSAKTTIAHKLIKYMGMDSIALYLHKLEEVLKDHGYTLGSGYRPLLLLDLLKYARNRERNIIILVDEGDTFFTHGHSHSHDSALQVCREPEKCIVMNSLTEALKQPNSKYVCILVSQNPIRALIDIIKIDGHSLALTYPVRAVRRIIIANYVDELNRERQQGALKQWYSWSLGYKTPVVILLSPDALEFLAVTLENFSIMEIKAILRRLIDNAQSAILTQAEVQAATIQDLKAKDLKKLLDSRPLPLVQPFRVE